jgi:kynureninase
MEHRRSVEQLDAADPLAGFRSRVLVPDPELIYLDGNSLGRPPVATLERVGAVLRDEWGAGLIRSWNEHWLDLPQRVGDLIGTELLGAATGQVVVADSTTVNFFKLAAAALEHAPGRRVIVTDRHNFPTDRYVLEGLAATRGLDARFVAFDEVEGPTAAAVETAVESDTALVTLSHVDYRSGALADMAAINEVAHRAGALVLWDLSHSAGAVPIDVDGTGTDLAVGCTYKYLNGGPGAPAFLYVRRSLQEALRPPVWGWFGQRDQFAMADWFDPVAGVGRFLSGTPYVLGLAAVEEGVRLLAEAGMDRLRAKSVALTELAIALADEWLTEQGVTVASPRDASRRGSHVALAHPDGYRLCRALIEEAGVVPDFRPPDRIRLGLAPLYTRFVDVWDALDRLRAILIDGAYRTRPLAPFRVT